MRYPIRRQGLTQSRFGKPVRLPVQDHSRRLQRRQPCQHFLVPAEHRDMRLRVIGPDRIRKILRDDLIRPEHKEFRHPRHLLRD